MIWSEAGYQIYRLISLLMGSNDSFKSVIAVSDLGMVALCSYPPGLSFQEGYFGAYIVPGQHHERLQAHWHYTLYIIIYNRFSTNYECQWLSMCNLLHRHSLLDAGTSWFQTSQNSTGTQVQPPPPPSPLRSCRWVNLHRSSAWSSTRDLEIWCYRPPSYLAKPQHPNHRCRQGI